MEIIGNSIDTFVLAFFSKETCRSLLLFTSDTTLLSASINLSLLIGFNTRALGFISNISDKNSIFHKYPDIIGSSNAIIGSASVFIKESFSE